MGIEENAMRYQNFVERVQEMAHLGSLDDAARAAAATLETLGERLSQRKRDNLAAQLANELKEHLCARHSHTGFPLEEFYDRVGARAEVRYHRAVELALVVISVLKEVVPSGEIQDILAELPTEYGELFGTQQPNASSPTVAPIR
jgi:uncharacterized protein (DUF2267 family)